MPATIEDVARLAEVSTATVSRVLNSSPLVSEEARQRVLAAIRQLDYKVNLAARTLRTNQTRTIAIVILSIVDPVVNQIVEAVEDAAILQDYTLLMCSTRGDVEREKDYIRLLTKQTVVDGVLYVSPRVAPEEIMQLAQSDLPLVFCNYTLPTAHIPNVMFDHVGAIYQTTHHLLAQGHQRIALLNLDEPYYNPSRMRREGFEKAFLQEGLSPIPSLIVEIRQPTYDSKDWRDAINILMDHPQPPTAIVAFNDQVALQVYEVCRERGLGIPHDLAVTGCDDILTSRHVDPPLTTVRLPAYEQGQLAMHYLLKQMTEKDPRIPSTTMLGVELITRQSSAKQIGEQKQ